MSNFKHLLAELPVGLSKFADIESPDESQLEQDFGRMAYTFLVDRAKPLIPYLLGFEVVEREEDGSRAVGIFGFKISGQYYYVPVFFVNNQIKGMDMLYSKKTNMFVPLQEAWLNYIVNKQTIELGGSADDTVRKDFENPNFDFIAEPPSSPAGVSSNKYGEDKSAGYDTPGVRTGTGPYKGSLQRKLVGKGKRLIAGEECPEDKECPEDGSETDKDLGKKDKKQTPDEVQPDDVGEAYKDIKTSIDAGFEVWNELQEALVDALEKDSEFQLAWSGAVSRLEHSQLPFEKTADNSNLIAFMQNSGGVRSVNSFMHTLIKNPSFLKAALQFYPDTESLFVTQFDESLAPEKQAAKITVITETTDYINGKEKRRLVRDGFTVQDAREPDEISETYELDYEKRFSNPEVSGVYDVLLRTGGTAKSWVFLPSSAAKSNGCTVVNLGSKHYFTAEPGAVFVRGNEADDSPSAYDKAIDLTKLQPGRKYILIDPKLYSTMPFHVKSVIAENGKRVKYSVNWEDYVDHKRPKYIGDEFKFKGENSYPCCENTVNGRYLQLATHKNGAITMFGDDTCVVPANWRAMELITPKRDDSMSYESERVIKDVFQPGSLCDVTEALNKNAFCKLTVGSDDGMDYYIRFNDDFVDGRPGNYKQACLKLITKYGLSVDDAEIMLKEARDAFKSRRLVKLGQMVGVTMPPPVTAPNVGYNDFANIPVQYPERETVEGVMHGLPEEQDPNQPGFNIGGEAEMDIGARTLAEQAAAAGQKQVFDHASIGGLAKLYDSGAVIDGYIPELLKAQDRLGRILFLFYWKNEEFAERYGTGDLAEMEDMLRGVFKSFGDLTLQLRQKAIDAEGSEAISV